MRKGEAPKIFAISLIKKNEVNNYSIGENSPNLVTLFGKQICHEWLDEGQAVITWLMVG
jgi:hypothetical protein